jgi:hypothetical protein
MNSISGSFQGYQTQSAAFPSKLNLAGTGAGAGEPSDSLSIGSSSVKTGQDIGCAGLRNRAGIFSKHGGDDDGQSSKPHAQFSFATRAACTLVLGLVMLGAAGCTPKPAEPPRNNPPAVECTTGTASVEQTRGAEAIFQQKNLDPVDETRIDILRMTTTEHDDDGDKTVDVPLAPGGVTLPGGLFLDTNGNITYDPMKADQGYHTTTIQHPHFGGTAVIERDGGTTTVQHPLWGGTTTISDDGDGLCIKNPHWGGTTSVDAGGGVTTVRHPLLGGTTTITDSGDTTTVKHPGLGGQTVISHNGANTTIRHPGLLGGTTAITENSNTTTIAHPGLGGRTVITKDGNVTTIRNPGFGGTTVITENGDTVTVKLPGFGGTVTITQK